MSIVFEPMLFFRHQIALGVTECFTYYGGWIGVKWR